MKKLAIATAALIGLATPAIACPGHDVETPKTAENPAPSRTADKAKPADQKPDAKKTDDPKKADATKTEAPKKPDKVSVR